MASEPDAISAGSNTISNTTVVGYPLGQKRADPLRTGVNQYDPTRSEDILPP